MPLSGRTRRTSRSESNLMARVLQTEFDFSVSHPQCHAYIWTIIWSNYQAALHAVSLGDDLQGNHYPAPAVYCGGSGSEVAACVQHAPALRQGTAILVEVPNVISAPRYSSQSLKPPALRPKTYILPEPPSLKTAYAFVYYEHMFHPFRVWLLLTCPHCLCIPRGCIQTVFVFSSVP